MFPYVKTRAPPPYTHTVTVEKLIKVTQSLSLTKVPSLHIIMYAANNFKKLN